MSITHIRKPVPVTEAVDIPLKPYHWLEQVPLSSCSSLPRTNNAVPIHGLKSDRSSSPPAVYSCSLCFAPKSRIPGKSAHETSLSRLQKRTVATSQSASMDLWTAIVLVFLDTTSGTRYSLGLVLCSWTAGCSDDASRRDRLYLLVPHTQSVSQRYEPRPVRLHMLLSNFRGVADG